MIPWYYNTFVPFLTSGTHNNIDFQQHSIHEIDTSPGHKFDVDQSPALLQIDVEMSPLLHSTSNVEPSEEIDLTAALERLILPQANVKKKRYIINKNM